MADYCGYSLYLLAFLCDPASADKSKSYTAVATLTTLNIHVNLIPQLSTLYAAELADDDFRGYLKMKRMPQKKTGFIISAKTLKETREITSRLKRG